MNAILPLPVKNKASVTIKLAKGVHLSTATEYKYGHVPYPFTKEQLAKRGKSLSKSLKGHKVSEATREKIRRTLIERNKGKPRWNGHKSREDYILSIKEGIAGRPKPAMCEICSTASVICFDHCHRTNKFRGWICTRCNKTLGMVKDDIDLLLKLIGYIKKHNVN